MKPKNQILALLCILTLGVTHAQTPGLQWASQTGSPFGKTMQAMAIDYSGNTLVAIYSTESFDFAGSQISYESLLDSTSGATLIKIDPEGNVLWHRSLRGPLHTDVNCGGITTDLDDNIYVTFRAASAEENAVTIGGLEVTSTWLSDNFLVKISPEGDGLWYRQANYTTGFSSNQYGLCKVGGDAVYVSGFLGTSVNFDGVSLNNEGFISYYVVKHDLEGNVQWAKLVGTIFGFVWLDAMEVDSEGSLYLAGEWLGEPLQIDSLIIENELEFTGNSDRWICKLSPEGVAEWLVREHSDGNQRLPMLTMSPTDELLVMSEIQNEDLYIGDSLVSGTGVVLSRYSASGEVLTASLVGSNLGDFVLAPSIVSADSGSFYAAGSYTTSTFNFGGLDVINPGGNTGTGNAFVAKMDLLGEAEWIYTFGNEESETARFVDAKNADRLVVGGSYTGLELNIQGTILTPNTAFNTEQFIASFSTVLNTRTAEALQQLLAYPNPFSENIQFDAKALQAFENTTLVVFSTNGVEVYRKQLQGHALGQLNLAHLPAGAYVARLSDGKRSLHTKLVKH